MFPRLIYGLDHPYGRPELGTAASVQSLTRDDAVAFYKKIMVPGNATLIVVGDVQTEAIALALEARFRGWRPARSPEKPSVAAPAAKPPPASALPDRQAGSRAIGPDRSVRSAPPANRPIILRSW